MERRYLLGVLGTGIAGMVAVAAAVMAYLWPRRVSDEFDAGPVSSFAVGDVKHFSVPGAGDVSSEEPALRSQQHGSRDFHLVRRADGFVAFWHRCTHLGCTVPFRPEVELQRAQRTERGYFRCPCHGSTFSRDEGQIVAGPAPRSLDALPIRIHGGHVLVTVREGAERRRTGGEAPVIARP